MLVDYIIEQWKQDSKIDQSDLATVTSDTAILHAKYLQWLIEAKLKLKRLEAEQKVLLKDKWLYYNGKMTRDEIDQRGWVYDPLDGMKVMKGDMDRFYESDEDIQKSQAKIDYVKTTIEMLTQIVDVLKWRHQHVRNIIDWKRFEAGS